MCSQLGNKELAFCVRCKPSTDAENDSYTVRKGNISRVVISDTSSIAKSNFPTEEILGSNQDAENQDEDDEQVSSQIH